MVSHPQRGWWQLQGQKVASAEVLDRCSALAESTAWGAGGHRQPGMF